MKNTIRGIIFWIIALAKIVTINAIMNLVYVLLPVSIVYILKNF